MTYKLLQAAPSATIYGNLYRNLGLGRHWHFLSDIGWLITGIVYTVLRFATDEWRPLVPTSWSILPGAYHAALIYLSFHLVVSPGAYNALQQLAYFSVVFLLAPFAILTGLAMSPSISARFPWYIQIFHGRQAARSLHFLCLCAFTLFFIGHVTRVLGEAALDGGAAWRALHTWLALPKVILLAEPAGLDELLGQWSGQLDLRGGERLPPGCL